MTTQSTDINYKLYDSKDPSGKGLVAFTDISTVENLLTNVIADNQSTIQLGFDFNFYGDNFNQIVVGDNGGIAFRNSGTAAIGPSNANIPNSNTNFANSIFPFWDDLHGGKIYRKIEPDKVIIQWDKAGSIGADITFQVVLHKDSNNIDFVYKDTIFGNELDNGASATIGLNKGLVNGKATGLLYSYNTASLNGISSIRFLTEPQLVNNISLTVKEGETVTLTPNNFNTTDVDKSDPAKIKYIIQNLLQGQFKVNGNSLTEFTQKDINDGIVQFVHDGGEVAPSFDVEISDRVNRINVKLDPKSIDFTHVNDEPKLSALTSSITFNENALNAAADIINKNSSVTLNDIDSQNFNGGNLTVIYSSGGGAEDQLSIGNGASIALAGRNISFDNQVIGTIDESDNGSNGKKLVVKFTTDNASLAAVKALIQNLTYKNTSDTPAASRTISVTVNDGDGIQNGGKDTSTPIQTVIDVTAENDAPVNKLPLPPTLDTTIRIDEDKTLTFSNSNLISISDPDAGDKAVRVRLTAANGTLNLSGTNTNLLKFNVGDGTDDGVLEFEGSIAEINKALNGMSFKPTNNFNGAASVKILTEDLSNSGVGVNLTDEDTVNITVEAVNDAPVNKVPTSTEPLNVKEDEKLIFSSDKGNAISISDVDVSENASGVIQVALSVNKGTLTLAQSSELKSKTGDNTREVIIEGTVAAVNTALNGLTYQGGANVNGADTLNIITKDLGNTGKEGEKQATSIVNIFIKAVNDAPVNTVPTAQTVNEDESLVFSSAKSNGISISDIDVNEGNGEVEVTLKVTKGTLTLADTTGVMFSEPNANGSKSMTLTGKLDAVNKALDGLTYRGDLNFNGKDVLDIITNDLENKGEINPAEDPGKYNKTVDITVKPVNDAPVSTLLPGIQSVNEDTNLVFSAANKNAITISDVDVDGENNVKVTEVQVTLAVNNGKLTLTNTQGITFDPNKGNGGSNVVFSGSLENINKALDGLTYLGEQDYNKEDTLTISINDKANGGSGGELLLRDTVKVFVNPVNDDPINLVPTQKTVQEDTDLVFNADGNGISIKDVDIRESATGEAEVKLVVTKGTLTLKDTIGLTFKEGNGQGNAVVSFAGKQADINKALASLTYRGDTNFHGSDTLTITTSDKGNTGSGGILTDTDEVSITVTPVNDAPVNSLPGQQNVDEDKNLIFSTQKGNAISISDVDADEGKGEIQVTLSVTKGFLTLKDATKLSFTAGDGKANATMTFTGKVADVNNALNGLVYRGEQDYHGSETLTITTSDLGNFGNEIQIDKDTIGINVIPDIDADGINAPTEQQAASEIVKQSADDKLKNLSQRAVDDGGIVALFGADGGTTKPIIVAIHDDDQKQFGASETPVLVIRDVKTQRLEEVTSDPIAVFDSKDLKKSSLKKITTALDIIDFEVMPNSQLKDKDLQQKVQEGIKQKPIRVEIKLPDGLGDMPVNAILQRRADGTLYDFRRQSNSKRGQLNSDMLTGAVLEDRNLDGKADWAVVYLQDGEWGDEDGLSNGVIKKSLVAANLDFGASRIEARSSQDGLNFYGNRSFVQFNISGFSGREASEVGMARVRFGDNGQIIEVNGKAVNSLDEAKQAIIQRGETLFSSLTNKSRNPNIGNQAHTVAFEEGEQAVFFVIQDGTKDELLFNGANSKSVKFSLSSLNSGSAVFQTSADERGQTAKISFAGLFDIGARILTAEEARSQVGLLAIAQNQSQLNTTGELIDLKSSNAFDGKQVTLQFSLQREAGYKNSVYLYRVDDAKGSIKDPLTGMLLDPTTNLSADQRQRYFQLATGDSLVKDVEFQAQNSKTSEASITLKGGQYYAPFMVSNGTLSSIGNDYSRILTSYIGISNNGVDYIRNLGTNKFGFEDIIGGGDRDYNDMILSINQVKVTV
ncbi:MAG: DUF4114 domain-containing protein [Calothrix sp. FI2-JRJ7]|jgi:hypothetical protein|nr:DUF4114 domain-containing protein [Calothrix sp. FI2-JRJ7]